LIRERVMSDFEREAFEETAARLGYNLTMDEFETGEYHYPVTQDAWLIWQEAQEQAARAQGDGEAVAEVRAIGGLDYKWVNIDWLNVDSLNKGDKLYVHPPAQQVPESDLIDHIDLMSDEFKRIKALNPCDEISDLCDRALRVTKQNVPVVERAEKMERCISSLLWENAELKERLATPQPEAGEQWVRCDERLPTRNDEDPYGTVIGWDSTHQQAVTLYPPALRGRRGLTHWMPTGLTRPQPPKGGE